MVTNVNARGSICQCTSSSKLSKFRWGRNPCDKNEKLTYPLTSRYSSMQRRPPKTEKRENEFKKMFEDEKLGMPSRKTNPAKSVSDPRQSAETRRQHDPLSVDPRSSTTNACSRSDTPESHRKSPEMEGDVDSWAVASVAELRRDQPLSKMKMTSGRHPDLASSWRETTHGTRVHGIWSKNLKMNYKTGSRHIKTCWNSKDHANSKNNGPQKFKL